MADQRTGDTTGFSEQERAAMKERAQELRDAAKTAAKAGGKADKAAKDEQALLEKIAELGEADRAIAERVHALITAAAPTLAPRTYYGMPAYAKDGAVLVFLQPAGKFETRYATLGFNDNAALDDGAMWPTAYAIPEVTDEVAEQITALVERAVTP